MLKTLLVPLSGGDVDQTVLDTALTVARPFGAHIECFHNYLDGVEAAASLPPVSFLMGAALHSALEQLDAKGHKRAVAALQHCIGFCRSNGIPTEPAPAHDRVSAGMIQAHGHPADNLVSQARHHDLVVMARPTDGDGLPPDTLPQMLMKGGQPILLVPEYSSDRLLHHQLICWKDTAASARAMAAALPLLKQAKQVTILSADEGRDYSESAKAVVRHLSFHDIPAETARISVGQGPMMDALVQKAFDLGVDLLIMGGYSRGAARELWFGGCTQSAMERGGLPVFIAH